MVQTDIYRSYRPLFDLSRRSPVQDSGAAAERVIAEGQRPVSRRNQLGTVKERGAIEERPGKIGAVEHRFEEIRSPPRERFPLVTSSRWHNLRAGSWLHLLAFPALGVRRLCPGFVARSSVRHPTGRS